MMRDDKDQPYKDFKRFCDKLRCPLCGSQLDGKIHPTLARLYCVADNNEYVVNWSPNEETPWYESVRHRYSQYEYVISYGETEVMVARVNTDIHPSIRATHYETLLRYNGIIHPYFKQRLTEKELLKKLKLFQVFS